MDQSYNLSSFSNFGVKSVHIAAPGGNGYNGLLSTSYCETCWTPSGYRYMSGTSMAAPIVSGILAVIMSESNNQSPSFAKNQLLSSAVQLEALQDKVSSGGFSNLRSALNSL